MTLNEAIEAAVAICKAGRIPALLGIPGVAKTAAAPIVQKMLGLKNLYTLIPSQREAFEYGLPVVDEGRTSFKIVSSPDLLPSAPSTLFFVDEFSDGNVPQQNFVRNLIYDRHIKGWSLAPDSMIMLAGNMTEHRSGANKIVTKLAGVIVPLLLKDTDDDGSMAKNWAEAMGDQVEDWIAAVLASTAEVGGTCKFIDFDASRALPINATPRTWHMFSDVWRQCEADGVGPVARMAALSGCVGYGAAAGMLAMKDQIDKLATIQEIAKDPKKAKLPHEKALQFIQAYMLGSKHMTPAFLPPVLEYLGRMGDEWRTIAVMLAHTNPNTRPDLWNDASFRGWISAPDQKNLRTNLLSMKAV